MKARLRFVSAQTNRAICSEKSACDLPKTDVHHTGIATQKVFSPRRTIQYLQLCCATRFATPFVLFIRFPMKVWRKWTLLGGWAWPAFKEGPITRRHSAVVPHMLPDWYHAVLAPPPIQKLLEEGRAKLKPWCRKQIRVYAANLGSTPQHGNTHMVPMA